MIHYILQVIVFQLLFLVVYDVFLKRETFFQYNRLYLLATPLLSFILPFVKFEALQAQIPSQFIVQLPAVLVGTTQTQPVSAQLLDAVTISSTDNDINSFAIMILVWGIGAALALFLFIYKCIKIKGFVDKGTLEKIAGYQVVILPETTSAFSFFNTIFIGDQLTEAQKKHIFLHEKVHIRQRHTLDLLFFELLKIIFWFNPLSYVFQKRITELQEYIADRTVAQLQGNTSYYTTLLNQVFQTKNITFINTFFNHSFIKKRITMLQKSKSNRIQLIKYITIIPLVFAMVLYTSCINEQVDSSVTSENETEVMQKINELAEAIMKKGNLSDEEVRALKMLATESNEGDKVYTSVNEYLTEEVEEIPFAVIEKAPTYPGCNGDNASKKKCMSEQIQKLVMENFNTTLADNLSLKGRQRIMIQFKIDQLGIITNIKARAQHPALEAEATRVVSKIPQMTPGEQDGKNVSVLYSLPILFDVEE